MKTPVAALLLHFDLNRPRNFLSQFHGVIADVFLLHIVGDNAVNFVTDGFGIQSNCQGFADFVAELPALPIIHAHGLHLRIAKKGTESKLVFKSV